MVAVLSADDVAVDRLVISSSAIALSCPCCGAEQEGFVTDPRGGTFECDDCGRKYYVPFEPVIKFY